MQLKIEYLPIGKLKTYANNAKLHPAEQIEQIKKSIEQFGFNDPVAIWGDDTIIEGHGRLIAAQELGLKKIPVIRLDNLSDEQRKAYALVHNKLTMNSGFDFALLQDELRAIDEFDMKDFGFGDFELSLRMIASGLNVVRFNGFTCKARHMTRGGCQDDRLAGENEKCFRALVNRYPQFVRPSHRKGEIRYVGDRATEKESVLWE